MTDPTPDYEARFNELVRELELEGVFSRGGSSALHYGDLYSFLARLADVSTDEIHVTTAEENKNVLARLGSGQPGSRHYEVGVLILREPATADYALQRATRFVSKNTRGFSVLAIADKDEDEWTIRHLVGDESSSPMAKLRRAFDSAKVAPVSPIDPSQLPSPERFDELVKEIPLGSTAPNKYSRLKEFLAEALHLDVGRIYVTSGNSNNITVRPTQGQEGERHHEFGLFLLNEDGPQALEYTVRQARKRLVKSGKGGYAAFAIATESSGKWSVHTVLEGAVKSEILKRVFPSVNTEYVGDTEPSVSSPDDTLGEEVDDVLASVPVAIDPRIERMLKLSISSSRAVMLVGPPGTAKTSLLEQVIRDIGENPEAHGFELVWQAKWVTPEESWTTRDLVGGETVAEDLKLRFRPGHVLESLREGRWLVLDEANRADMDKIMGSVLTWLSGKSVELGRSSTAPEAPVVTLGWARGSGNEVNGYERLKGEESGEGAEEPSPIEFLAGKEWRLLGTYNALDAQRVFRFGQALGRRFVRVPVPLISSEELSELLVPLTTDLPDYVRSAVLGLYEQHSRSETLALGPAVFMWIPRYVRKGCTARDLGYVSEESRGETETIEEEPVESSLPLDDSEGENEESRVELPEEEVEQPSRYIESLVAEAYLSAVGPWLANAEEDELDALGHNVVHENILPGREWDWIRDLLNTMR